MIGNESSNKLHIVNISEDKENTPSGSSEDTSSHDDDSDNHEEIFSRIELETGYY